MGKVKHSVLSGAELHEPKAHASSHAAAGADALSGQAMGAWDCTEIYNSAGDLKIMPDVQGDVKFFGDGTIGDETDGKAAWFYRNAVEGTDFFKLYVDQYRWGVITSSSDMKINSGGSWVRLDPGIQLWSSGASPILRHYGDYNSSDKYVDFNEASDYYTLTREDTDILGFKIDMPVDLVSHNLTTTGLGDFGSGITVGTESGIPFIDGDVSGTFGRLLITPESGNMKLSAFYMPSGTEDQSSIQVRNSDDLSNYGRILLQLNGAVAQMTVDKVGTGTIPTTFQIGEAESSGAGLTNILFTFGNSTTFLDLDGDNSLADFQSNTITTLGTINAQTFSGTLGTISSIRCADGLVGSPSITFASDTNTGMWRSAPDTLNWSTAGTERLEIDASEATFAVPIGMGGNNIEMGEGNINEAGDITSEGTITGATVTDGTLAMVSGDLASPNAITIKPNSDANDYFQFEIVAGVSPFLKAIGGTLFLDADSDIVNIQADDLVTKAIDVNGTITMNGSDMNGADNITTGSLQASGSIEADGGLSTTGSAPVSGRHLDIGSDGAATTTVRIYNSTPTLTTGKLLYIYHEGSSNMTGNLIKTEAYRSEFAGALVDDFDSVSFFRSSAVTGGGAQSLNAQGSVVKIDYEIGVGDNLTDSVIGLEIVMGSSTAGNLSAGDGLQITHMGTGLCLEIITNASQGKEAMMIDQNDQDKAFIDFAGTSAADQTKNISTVNGDGSVEGPKNYSSSAGWQYEGMIKVEISGTERWMPFYSADVS